jgi:hypothetical protein
MTLFSISSSSFEILKTFSTSERAFIRHQSSAEVFKTFSCHRNFWVLIIKAS